MDNNEKQDQKPSSGNPGEANENRSKVDKEKKADDGVEEDDQLPIRPEQPTVAPGREETTVEDFETERVFPIEAETLSNESAYDFVADLRTKQKERIHREGDIVQKQI